MGWSLEARMAASERMKVRRSNPAFMAKLEASKRGRKPKQATAALVKPIELNGRELSDAVIRFGYAIGRTASEIGRFIGISRNAVIGRAHRMGIAHSCFDEVKTFEPVRSQTFKNGVGWVGPAAEKAVPPGEIVAAEWEKRLEQMFG